MSDDKMLTVEEVAERLAVSKATAYAVIRQLNERAAGWGCTVIPGRVSKRLFEDTYFKMQGGSDER